MFRVITKHFTDSVYLADVIQVKQGKNSEC